MKNPSYPEFQRHHPLRPADWRWRRACWLVEGGHSFSARRDDPQTGRAVRYLRALARSRSGRRRALKQDLDLHAARQLHEHGGQTAVEVQARLLARQSFAEVARITGVPVETVEMYEALFYNVVGHLGARDWVTTQAVGWWAFDPTTGRDRATVLRAYAYHGGPLLLDAALPYLLGHRMDVQSGHDPLTPEGRLDRSLRLAILIETLPGGAKTDAKLFKLHAELLENAQSEGPPATQIEAVVARNAAELLDKLAVYAPGKSSEEDEAAGDNVAHGGVRETA